LRLRHQAVLLRHDVAKAAARRFLVFKQGLAIIRDCGDQAGTPN
jgi:hypothetical protein